MQKNPRQRKSYSLRGFCIPGENPPSQKGDIGLAISSLQKESLQICRDFYFSQYFVLHTMPNRNAAAYWRGTGGRWCCTKLVVSVQIRFFLLPFGAALLQKMLPSLAVFMAALVIIRTGFLTWNHEKALLSLKQKGRFTNSGRKTRTLSAKPAVVLYLFTR